MKKIRNELILAGVAMLSLVIGMWLHSWIGLCVFAVSFGIVYIRATRVMGKENKQIQRGLSAQSSIPPAIRGNTVGTDVNIQVILTVLAIESKHKRVGVLKVLRRRVTSNASGILGVAYEVISDRDGSILNTNSLSDAVDAYNNITE